MKKKMLALLAAMLCIAGASAQRWGGWGHGYGWGGPGWGGYGWGGPGYWGGPYYGGYGPGYYGPGAVAADVVGGVVGGIGAAVDEHRARKAYDYDYHR